MSIGNFQKAFCPIHALAFKQISVCGIMIDCCVICTSPTNTVKKKSNSFYGPRKKEISKNSGEDRRMVAKESRKGQQTFTLGSHSYHKKRGSKRTNQTQKVCHRQLSTDAVLKRKFIG